MTKLLEQYKNQFTLDNKLKPQPGVTVEKVKDLKRRIEKAMAGDRVEEARLQELFTSTDAGFSLAHLLNIQTIPQLPKEEEESLVGLAGSRTVRDFRPVVLQSIFHDAGLEGAGIDKNGAASIVPEGTPYPMVKVTKGYESFYSKLAKRGLRFDFTWEGLINDVLGTIEDMPGQLVDVYGATINAEVFEALDQSQTFLESVQLPNGEHTTPNASVSASALIAASVAYENREINGIKRGAASGYNVVVPIGQKRFLEYDLAQYGRIITVQNGEFTLLPDSAIQALMPNFTIVESKWVTGTNWFFLPKPGTTRRPVLEQLKLRGYENPEIRMRADQGFHPGGGQVGLYQGGYDADTLSMRLRIVTGAVLWDEAAVVRSNGTGQA